MGDVYMDISIVDTLDLVPCYFEGLLTTCYKDAAMRLTHKYGSDWKTPHRWCDWSSKRLCTDIDTNEEKRCKLRRLNVLGTDEIIFPTILNN